MNPYNPQDRKAIISTALERYIGADGAPLDNGGQTRLITRGGSSLLSKGYGATIERAGDVPGVRRLDDGTSINVEFPALTYAITTNSIDRANDRVEPSGVDIRNFAFNGPILWAHDHSIPPIGKGTSPRMSPRTAQGVSGILMDVVFHLETALSRELYAMASNGFLNAGSIGFIPLEWRDESAADAIKAGQAYPYSDTIRTYTKWELLEFSLCGVPMNPTALIQNGAGAKSIDLAGAVERGLITADAEVIALLGENKINGGALFVRNASTSELPTLIVEQAATAPVIPALVIENAKADAPGYTDATVDGESCATCEYADGAQCTKHDFMHGGDETVCDDYESISEEEGKSVSSDPADISHLSETLTQLSSSMTDYTDLAKEAGVSPETFAAVADAITKAGATLNKKNAERVKTIKSLAAEILADAGYEDGDKSIDGGALVRYVANDATPEIAVIRDGETIDIVGMLLDIAEKQSLMDNDAIDMKATLAELRAYIMPPIESQTETKAADEETPIDDVTPDGSDDETIEKTADEIPVMAIRFKGDEA
jgi:hypothetical protein